MANIDIEIEVLSAESAEDHLPRFSEILIDCVEGGAAIGHRLPVNPLRVATYWEDVLMSVGLGERVLIVARLAGEIVGLVQLILSPGENAPDRGDVFKLLVARKARERGVGEALMRTVEIEGRKRGLTLLAVNTVQGGAAERLCRRLGWKETDVAPGYLLDPWGIYRPSVHMMRFLDD
jgi:GNAT superfamily N-acetyltransferase